MNNQSLDKYKNKFRIKSARFDDYDYSQDGLYFVTICTQNKQEFFGRIENEEMVLSNTGKIVQEELLQTAIIRQNVNLDEWIIMPNHVHVIIEIYNGADMDDMRCVNGKFDCRDALQCVSTDGNASVNVMEYKNKFGPQKNNLASIIRGFKGAVKNKIYQVDSRFAWQPRFYDHIIRNENSLAKIREYIINNPLRWELDRNNPDDFNNIW